MDAYLKLIKDLSGSTRMRWGATCVHQHSRFSGWDHVFWDLPAARELLQTVRRRLARPGARRGAAARGGARSCPGLPLGPAACCLVVTVLRPPPSLAAVLS